MNAIWQEFRELDTSRKALRNFGLLVGGVLLAIAGVVLWRNGWEPNVAVYVLGGVGAILIAFGAVAPGFLKPVYKVWMLLALLMGFVMTRVLLTLVYFLLMTPIGLILRLLGKDPMERRIDRAAASYWIKKTYTDETPARLEKYY